MAKKYKVLERSFINGHLLEAGAVVTLEIDNPGSNLELLPGQDYAAPKPAEQSGGEGGAGTGYAAKFNGGTRWRVVDAAGNWFSDFIGASKEDAQAEADRLNAGGQPFVKPAEQSGGEGGVNNDGHPDA